MLHEVPRHSILICLVVTFVIASTQAIAQKRKLVDGSLKGLKSQKSYNIRFTYDSLIVGQLPEQEYLRDKKRDWEMKQPGSGTAFVNQWFADRKALYEPAFIKTFEKYYHVKLKDKNAPYILIVKTKRIEGGWYAGVLAHPAELDGELWIADSADESHVIAKIEFSGIIGKVSYGGDFEINKRIQSVYQVAGYLMGDFMKHKVK